MKKVHAEFNHGRWIVICPACLREGVTSAMQVQPGDVFVCPEEYPNLMAKTLVPNPRMAGAFNSVPDEVLRAETKQRAIDAGDAYDVVFPPKKEMSEIERVLRPRPRGARNWFAGISVAELKDENERMLRHA